MSKIITGLWLAGAATSAVAQTGPNARVDSVLRAEMTRRLIPGLGVAVVRAGKVLKTSTYGLANVELGVPASAATLFQIASTTKNFTGVAIMQLVEAGKFRLDDSVRALLPRLPARWGAVTVRHLLSHTSGLPDVVLDAETGDFMRGPVDSVLLRVAALPADSPPGRGWSYNQTNYLLLGELVAKFSGLTFTDYARQRLFGPLGMKSATFGDTRSVIPGRTSEYSRLRIRPDAKRLTDLRALSYEYSDWLMTAAGIFATANDMTRWLLAVDAGKLLRPESFREMTTTATLADGTPVRLGESPPLGYGLGWITVENPARRAVGGSGGGRAAVLYYPEQRLGIAILTNLQGSSPEELVAKVAELYLDPVRR